MRYAIQGATVEQVKAVGATAIKEARSINIIFATLTTEQVAKLKAQGVIVGLIAGVKAAVMPSPRVPAPVAAEPIYSAEELLFVAGYDRLRSITTPPLYGAGFNLAMVDSGIRSTHSMIKGRVVHSKNFTTDVMGDNFDHGTGTASLAVAVAPQCNLLNLKVLDSKGFGTEEEVILAIDYCIALRDEGSSIAPHVINLSLGSPDEGNPNSPMRIACRAAIDRAIWIFASGGNDGPAPGKIMSPACERYVSCTGSVKYDPYVISEFSSRGPTKENLTKPDACMWGENFIVASSVSDTATVAKSGTSFSNPLAAGMAILTREGMYRQAVLADPVAGLDPETGWRMTVEDLIDYYYPIICVKPAGIIVGKDNDYGYGLPFPDTILQAVGFRPAIGMEVLMSSITPLLGIGILSMLMSGLMKSFR
ncbi:hypothetical protein ES703_90433 [subsurface metagenome]